VTARPPAPRGLIPRLARKAVRQSLKALAPARMIAVRVFERAVGVRTWANIEREELGFVDGYQYLASSWLMLEALFRKLDIGEDEVFADLGSGMGRVIYMAARWPFKRVIGVERSEQLNEVARANIERNRGRLRCQDIEIVATDVRGWEIPDDLTLVYIYKSFTATVLQSLVAGLSDSVARCPREVRLVFNLPWPDDLAVLRQVGRPRRLRPEMPVYVRHRFDNVWLTELAPEELQSRSD
jgi:SAM-dependent methyltransferase